jgi:transcriptional regulator with XRE-family HTH domain
MTGEPEMGDVLADNLRAARRRSYMSQEDVARAMREVGHGWAQNTVSVVERGARNVTVNELLHLAVALRTSVPDLLDPMSVTEGPVRVGGTSLPAAAVRAWIRGALVPEVLNR